MVRKRKIVRVIRESSIFTPTPKPVSTKMLRKGEDNFRMIKFAQTETRLGKPPETFLAKENLGKSSFDKITFLGTKGRLGPAPPRKRSHCK
jgi:hypothetical protein